MAEATTAVRRSRRAEETRKTVLMAKKPEEIGELKRAKNTREVVTAIKKPGTARKMGKTVPAARK